METPTNLGVAFVRSTKPKSNCRLERATYEITAPSGSPFVRLLIFSLLFYYFWSIFSFAMERYNSPISVDEASKISGLSVQQIRTLCRDNTIPATRFGKVWQIDRKSLLSVISNTCHGKESDCNRMPPNISSNRPIALSFFSGAMGLDIGLEKAGIQTVLCSEIDSACRKTIKKNKPDIALIGDIRDYTAQEILEQAGLKKSDVDVIVGGPPCQAFSTAGKRLGFEDQRGNVFLKYLEIISEIRPKYAIIENVRGLLSAPLKHRPHAERGANTAPLSEEEQPGGALKHILSVLKSNGYSVSFNLYNSANFGSPQKRERVVLICSRTSKKPPYLTPTHSENGENNLPKWKTVKDAIGRLKCEHTFVPFPEKRLRFYRLLGPGENWRHLPISLQKEALGGAFNAGGGKSGFLRRLAWDKPSPTLVTHPAMPATDLAHPIENRPLSIQEYRKIQEFPDNWHLEGSKLEQYKQIGNAVPISLGHAIGKLLVSLLAGEKPATIDNFKFSRYNGTNDSNWEDSLSK